MPEVTQQDKVTVEADTVEAALAEISTQLGEDAEIMRAQKVHRGGVGGFFAKEMVQLTARRRRGSAPARPESVPARPHANSGDGIADVLERMAQDADAADGDFRTVLRRELESTPADSGSQGFLAAVGWEAETENHQETETPAETVEDAVAEQSAADEPRADDGADTPEPVAVGPVLHAAPVFPDADVEDAHPTSDVVDIEPAAAEAGAIPFEFPAEPEFDEVAEAHPGETAEERPEMVEPLAAPPGMGRVDWSTTALLRLGMPAPVIEAAADLESNHDLAWIEGIAAAVAPHCGALPVDDVIVVGPHAERLAEPLGLPLVHAGEMAPYDGSFCAMVEDTARDREWLEYVQGGRGIHLVIGDEPWQDLLIGEPVAVSWVGETAVSDALYLAFTLGATLGYGTVDGFVSSMVRAQPTDVALAVRRIVGRQ
ncbi:MAG: hypothetical protein QNJ77_12740 [Acidimicrobiia bacterium]|nr:hypothetical protein [Acidimicrobiia bacterium]